MSGLARLRISHPRGTKNLVIRLDSLPTTYGSLVAFLSSRAPALNYAPEEVQLAFVDKQGQEWNIVDDEDARLLWQVGGPELFWIAVRVQSPHPESDRPTRSKSLPPPSRAGLQRTSPLPDTGSKEGFQTSINSTRSAALHEHQKRDSPSPVLENANGERPASAAVITRAPHDSRDGVRKKGPITRETEHVGHEHTYTDTSATRNGDSSTRRQSHPEVTPATNGATPHHYMPSTEDLEYVPAPRTSSQRAHTSPPGTVPTPSSSPTSTPRRKPRTPDLSTKPLPAIPSLPIPSPVAPQWPKWPTLGPTSPPPPSPIPLTVTAGGRTYTFPLQFKNEREFAVEEIMGVLGGEEWAVQRGWGYKRVAKDPSLLSTTYAAKESDVKMTADGFGYVRFVS
ncbi:hypothetical protein M427DRAFT_334761 [Gonapodya prolifera JEL478]|uniref:Uncharacterized protein n=1 Tax=Gonapodya prolifera (strain JEL478) TaxID=1344416 RepID=A0A139ADA4_GONPJ|nr:hypothetical protein M427DRAFT_334761 [Gonapodya prolifera JEL478]|eukprot:KXS14806.1 hypothetical protein M427DRAFT_334761 [Gonapodya prolifera JEL478]